MDPLAMDGYGYGSDNLDSAFSKYTYPGQTQYPQPPQSQHQAYPQQQEQQVYGDQQQHQQQSSQPQPAQDHGMFSGAQQGSKKILETFNSAFPDTKKDLLFTKSFYFFFFAAFGSLFPLIGIYFKQLGMSPLQTGFLIGLRPFVELAAGPFWGDLAERWKKWKMILIGSLACWIIFTVSLAFVQPPANSCLIHNGTNIFVAQPYTIGGLTFENMKPPENLETRRKRSLIEEFFGLPRKQIQTRDTAEICSENNPNIIMEVPNDGMITRSSGGRDQSVKKCSWEASSKKKNASAMNDVLLLKDGEQRKVTNGLVRSKRSKPQKKKKKLPPTTTVAEPEEVGEGEEVEEEKEEDEEEERNDEEERDTEKKEEEVDSNEGKNNEAKDDKEDKKETTQEGRTDKGKKEITGEVKNGKDKKETIEEGKGGKGKKEIIEEGKTGKDKKESVEEEEDEEYVYYEIEDDEPFDASKVENPHRFYQFKEFPYPAIEIPGLSPLPLNHEHIMNLEKEDVKDLVSPPLSAVVYRIQDVRNVFLILLILQILGEFLSTPSLTLADAATLGYLNDQTENYGKQRIYGSLGWAVAMFFVGIALDYSNVFSNHPCGTEHLVDRNYMTCYAVFGVLMFCALLSALKFRFKEADAPLQSVPLQQFKEKVFDKVHQTIGSKHDQGKVGNGVVDGGMVNVSDQQESSKSHPSTNESGLGSNPITYIPRGKPGQAGTLPHWVAVLKMFAPIQFSSMFFVLWFVGFGVGLVFAFLFWHLQDLGGSPTLFGIASVINHLSELGAFLFIKKLVAKIGHLNVVYAGLIANVVRFITISYLSSPWAVLPFELLQGLTHAAVWAAGVSYMTQAIPEENKPTAQMILQSLHLAVGRGCGTVIGGIFISSYGTQSVFRGYGITCLIVAIGYFALNFFFISKLPPIVGAPPMTNEFHDDSAYLAPHGVPGSAVSRSGSTNKLDKVGMDQQQQYQQQQYQQQQQYLLQQYPQQQQQYSSNIPPAENQETTAYIPSYPQDPQRVSDGIYRPGHLSTQWGQF